jgi:drug/metabolite transporter (DMT)-like permease
VTSLAVLCALVCAAANATVSVLQRLAALGRSGSDSGRQRPRLLHSKAWWAGCAAMALAAAAQASALGLGSLSLVQPLLASELLFALVLGRLVFRRGPGRRTWLAFTALACGLAAFLVATDPSAGGGPAPTAHWLPVGLAVLLAVLTMVTAALRTSGAWRAALLGCATATGFALTAALIRDLTLRIGASGAAHLLGDWPLYAVAVAGGGSFVLLQATLRAGSLRFSQPALTLGDALVSLVLGHLLFGEQLSLGLRAIPAAAGGALIVAGVIGLSRAKVSASGWDTADARSGKRSPTT